LRATPACVFSYTGAVHRFFVSEWLVLVLAGPLFGLIYAIWGVLAERKKQGERLREIGFGACGVSAVLVVWQFLGVPTAAREAVIVQHVLTIARVGQLDLGVDLALDQVGAAVALCVCAAGAASFAIKTVTARAAILAHAATLGGLVAALADNVPLTAAGASIAALAAVIAARRSSAIGRIADVCFIVGAAAVFWSFGGRYAGERFVADLSPRFVAATPTKPAADDDDDRPKNRAFHPINIGGSWLSIDALPGATVYVDDALSRPLRTPIAHAPIDSGMHTVRIHAGFGLDDYVVPQIAFETGKEMSIAPFGPTLVYRWLVDEIGLEAPKELGAHRDSTLLGVGLALLGLGAFFRVKEVGALARSALVPPAAIAGAAAGALAFVRLAPLVATLPRAQIGFAIGGGVLALASAARAAGAIEMRAVCNHLTAVFCGISLTSASIGSGNAGAASVVLAAAGGSALFACVHGEPSEPKFRTAALVACAAITSAPLPIVGSIWALSGFVAPPFSHPSAWIALLLLALGAACAFATSYAAFRLHRIAFEKRGKIDASTMVLAIAALALSTLVGFSPRAVGIDDAGPVTIAPAAPVVGAPAFAAALILAGFALGGRAAARRRYASIEGWRARDAKLRAFDVSAAWLPRTLVSIARALDEHVIEFVARAVGGIAWAAGWLFVRVEEESPHARAGDRVASVARRISPPAAAIGALALLMALLAFAVVAR